VSLFQPASRLIGDGSFQPIIIQKRLQIVILKGFTMPETKHFLNFTSLARLLAEAEHLSGDLTLI
jgi:hypothetical protein